MPSIREDGELSLKLMRKTVIIFKKEDTAV